MDSRLRSVTAGGCSGQVISDRLHGKHLCLLLQPSERWAKQKSSSVTFRLQNNITIFHSRLTESFRRKKIAVSVLFIFSILGGTGHFFEVWIARLTDQADQA